MFFKCYSIASKEEQSLPIPTTIKKEPSPPQSQPSPVPSTTPSLSSIQPIKTVPSVALPSEQVQQHNSIREELTLSSLLTHLSRTTHSLSRYTTNIPQPTLMEVDSQVGFIPHYYLGSLYEKILSISTIQE